MNWILMISIFLSPIVFTYAQSGDSHTDAIPIQHQSSWSGQFSSLGATAQSPFPSGCSYSYGNLNRWFVFTATTNTLQLIHTDITTTNHHRIALWKKESGSLVEITCSTDSRLDWFDLQIGSEYYLSVDKRWAHVDYIFQLDILNTGNNDYWQGAQKAYHNESWSGQYSSLGATAQGPSPGSSCSYSYGNLNRWYTFTATSKELQITHQDITTNNPFRMTLWELQHGNLVEITCSTANDLTWSAMNIGSRYYLSVDKRWAHMDYQYSLTVSGGSSSGWTTEDGIIFPIDLDAQVGIGTKDVSEGYLLSVDGKAIVEELTVQRAEDWPDYVFKPDHQLRTLQEVRHFIDAHQHLPEIPSAQEIKSNGFQLGEMNIRLLKKIEELTLYQIQLLELITQQTERIDEQSKELNQLKQQLK